MSLNNTTENQLPPPIPTETQPLLPTPNQSPDLSVQCITLKSVIDQVIQLTKLTLPLTLSMTMLGGLNIVSTSYLGRTGTELLAAATLSMSYLGVTTLMPLMGLMTALDTLISQAHTNSHASKELPSIYLQRAIVIASLAMIPCTIVLWQFEALALYLGQDEIIAELGGKFTRFIGVMCFPLILYHNVRAYLTSQGIVLPFFISSILLTPIQVILLKSVLYIELFDDPVLVIPFVTTINLTISLATLIMLGAWRGGFKHWVPFSKRSFRGFKEFLSLGAGGMVLTCAEIWCIECFTLFSSYLGPEALAAQSVISTCFSICVLMCMGLQAAGTIRIGNLLGAGQYKMASVTSYTTIVFSTILGVIGWLWIQFNSRTFSKLFTSDPDLIEHCVKILQIVSIHFIFRSVNNVASGVLRGQGRQGIAAKVHIVTGYLVGIPLGYALAFNCDLGLLGLWIGLGTFHFLGSLGQFAIIYATDWTEQVRLAKERIQSSQ
jgi:MATE family multidrug resistance protein